MKEEFDFTLVMTASVNPNGMQGISKESTENREVQYIQTLSFYAQNPHITKILFVENSAHDLSHIKASIPNPEKVTFLSLDENNYPRAWGKGYGEFLLMDRVYDYLTAQSEDGIIVKVTGRFPILNIDTMLKEFARRKALRLAIDIKDHPIYDWLRLGWSGHGARTILYAVTYSFYREHIYGRYRQIPSVYVDCETMMFKVVKETMREKGVYHRFKHEPRLSGFAGGLNYTIITCNNYDSGLNKVKRAVNQFCRTCLPFIKL